jgi:hypothetical protein
MNHKSLFRHKSSSIRITKHKKKSESHDAPAVLMPKASVSLQISGSLQIHHRGRSLFSGRCRLTWDNWLGMMIPGMED